MILDQLENALAYEKLDNRITAGLALLKEQSVLESPAGKHEVDGDDLFYIVNEYETAPVADGLLEVHRKYMDIQYIVSGNECIGYAPLSGLKEQTPYDSENDAALYDCSPAMSKLVLKQGSFAIFWPNEPHMPGRSIDQAEPVKKIVIKIRIE